MMLDDDEISSGHRRHRRQERQAPQRPHPTSSRSRPTASGSSVDSNSLPDRDVRRRSVPLALKVQVDQDDDPLIVGGSSAPRDRRRKDVGQRVENKIEQVFFPPFEETVSEPSSSSGTEKRERIVDEVEDRQKKSTWASLLPPVDPKSLLSAEGSRHARQGPTSTSRVLNHRRTQSSTDIASFSSSRPPLRSSGFSLNKMDPVQTRPNSELRRSPPPRPRTVVSSISPLTKSARRMLGDTDENGLASPTEECPGGQGLLEAIRLDSLYRSRQGEGSGRISHEAHRDNKLRRSNTLPVGRNKRKALSVDMSGTSSSNKRFPAVNVNINAPPRALPEITVIEPPRPRNRPPPLRDLPPPSWSSPGPSPPLTGLATPFSTDMFVMPYPNPVATMTPGLLSPNYTPPHSPRRAGGGYHSVPITPRSDPMDEIYSPDLLPLPAPTGTRTRRRSSLASFESTTETIRPWHVVQLTPKPSRAQLSNLDGEMQKQQQKAAKGSKEEPVIVRSESGRGDRWRYPGVVGLNNNMHDNSARDHPLGLSLETLVCDWDFESDDDRDRDRDRGRPARSQESIARRKRLKLVGHKMRANRESIERERRAPASPSGVRA